MKQYFLIKRLISYQYLFLFVLLFCCFPGYAAISLPYSENFDTVSVPALPAGWTSISRPSPWSYPVETKIITYSTNNIGVTMSNNVITDEGEYMLISPEFTNLENSLLSFSACNGSQYGVKLIVGVMSNPADISSFVPIRVIERLPYFTLGLQTTGLVNLPEDARYVAFRHGNRNEKPANSPIYIDDFSLETLPANVAPSNLQGMGTSHSTARLSWGENGYAQKWEIKYGAPGFSPQEQGTSLIIENQPSTLLEGLSSFTSYEFYVRSILSDLSSSAWSGPASFSSTQVLKQVPFVEDFETSSTNEWCILNGTENNQWHIGSATAYEGSKSIYISDNNGTSNQYNLSTTSKVHFFRDIYFPEQKGKFVLKYRIKGTGQFLDYSRVHLADASYIPQAGEGLRLEYYIGEGQVYYNLNWTEKTIELDEKFRGKVCRLVFSWSNNNSGGTQPPAAIDNIQLLFEPYSIAKGRVIDPDGYPVEGARVVIGNLFTNTDAQGNYRLEGLPPGDYNIWCEAGGFATHFKPISILSGDSSLNDFQFGYSNPLLPTELSDFSNLPDNDGYQHSAINGAYVYSPNFENGLRIYDLSNPSAPQLVATKSIPSIGNAYFDNYLFVGSTSDRIEIFDCSSPTNPTHIHTWLIQGKAVNMAFNDDYAYVISQNYNELPILGVADIRDTSDIREVHTTTLSHTGWSNMAIDKDRDLLYLLGYTNDSSSLFSIRDISNPASIDEVYFTEIKKDVYGFVLSGQNVLIAYNQGEQGFLDVLETSDPANPALVMTHQLPEGYSIYETSEHNGTIFAFVRPGFSLVSFVYDPALKKIHQGLSLQVEPEWIDASLEFLDLPVSPLRFATTLSQTLYAVSAGNNYGSGSPPQKVYKITKKPDKTHSLTMAISPEIAATFGCTVSPAPGKYNYPAPTEVIIGASAAKGWFFSHWMGADGGAESKVMVNGEVEVTGVFGPVLTVSDTKKQKAECACEVLSGLYPVGTATFSAGGDDWKLMGFTIDASGTGDDAADIDSVYVIANNQIITRYNADNGKANISISPPIVIPVNTSFTVYLFYDFGFDPRTYALDTVQTFEWEIEGGSVIAMPVHYTPGLVEGVARMRELGLGRVLNDAEQAFSTIEEAVEQTLDGGSVILCPIEHKTNVKIDKNLTITGKDGKKQETIVKPQDPSKPTFQLMPEAKKTIIKDLIITK